MEKKDTTVSRIPVEGSLGLLALGDIGLDLWREAKQSHNLKYNE